MGAIRKNQIDSELFTPSKYLTLRQEKYRMAAICSKTWLQREWLAALHAVSRCIVCMGGTANAD